MSKVIDQDIKPADVKIVDIPSQFDMREVSSEVERYLGIDAGIPLDVKNRLNTIIEVINENGNTNDNSYALLFASIIRLGEIQTESSSKFIDTNKTTICKYGAGRLIRVLNVDNAGSVTVYDNTSASGAVIATIDTAKALGTLDFGTSFSNGLTVVTATGAKVVVIYE